MKFSLAWLKQYLDTEATAAEIAAKLNALGIEVEGLEDPAQRLAGFRIARVVSAAPHPNADKLQVLSVDTGAGEPLQVVCGAPNARAGLVGVLGTPGAVVPAGGFELKKSAIRGVESNGMMCSARELELGEDHAGIIELPHEAPVGTAFAEYRGAGPVFDVAITPNRPDCMGVHGIARDLAAAGLGTLRPARIESIAGSFPCPVEIRTDDPAGCPAFYGRVVRGVRNGPSPEWLQMLLRDAGQRPISALVDLTNYLMLAFGRPAHAYDLAKLSGAVVARRAESGEQVLALNGKTYTLTSEMTVIADDSGVHDIAGIMGGEHSGVSENDRRAAGDRLLRPRADRRHRAGAGPCQRRAHPLRTGRGPGLPRAGPRAAHRADRRALRRRGIGHRARRIGSDGSSPDRVQSAAGGKARRLGRCRGRAAHDSPRGWDFTASDDWTVQAPSWRPDIDGAADIVEEVVRVHGLDRVQSVPLPRAEGVARPTATPLQKLERRLRRAAAARGLDEAVTWSFIPEAHAQSFADRAGGLWLLENPISEEMKAMRPSLLPGLLAAAQRNVDRGAKGLRLFEIGRRYLRDGKGASDERLSLAVLLAGEKEPRGWASGKAKSFDAFDAKAEALALLADAGAPIDKLQVMGPDSLGPGAQFHPGQSGTLRLGPKTVLARFGALHPATLRAFDIGVPVAAVELFLDALPARKGGGFARPAYAPPALQAVERDFAFLVPAALPAGDLLRAVQSADKANIAAARVFDDFRGAGVLEGQKSLALEVTLQPQDKSYTDEELKAIAGRIVAAAAKLGAELRG